MSTMTAATATTSATTVPTSGSLPQPHLVIEPVSGWRSLKLRELWEFRDLITTLGMRDVKLIYKQTLLGVTWVALQPLIGAAIFTFVFGVLAEMPSEGIPYFLFSLTGMTAWTFFSTTLNNSSMVMVNNRPLVAKIYFPRLVLPLSAAFQPAVNLCVNLLFVVLMLAWFGVMPGWQLATAPLWLLSLLMFSLGVGFFCCSIMVHYRDLRYIIPVGIQFLLFASPVGYGLTAVNDKVPDWLARFYLLNPIASLLEAFRWSLLGVGQLSSPWLTYSMLVSLCAFFGGAFLLRRAERQFADVI